jgi:hypothetical protein
MLKPRFEQGVFGILITSMPALAELKRHFGGKNGTSLPLTHERPPTNMRTRGFSFYLYFTPS